MKNLLFLLFILPSLTLYSQIWEKKYPKPAYPPLTGSFFISETEGWCIGDSGTIIHTTDGGATFEKQPNPAKSQLFCVQFTSKYNGWVTGYKVLLHTVNSGKTWTNLTDTLNSLNTVAFTDSLHGFVAGEAGRFLRTQDGGKTWTKITFASLPDNFFQIAYTDPKHLWIVGNTSLWSSTDSGKTWLMKKDFPMNTVDVCFKDTLNGWVAGWYGIPGYTTGIFRTSDGGKTWVEQPYSGSSKMGPVIKIAMADTSFGWVLTMDHGLRVTKNGGKLWTDPEKALPIADGQPASMFFLNRKTAWVTTSPVGYVLRSTDSTKNWLRSPDMFSMFRGVYFKNEKQGWVIGGNGLILKSSDGGNSWSQQVVDPNVHLMSVSYLSDTNIWLLGNNYSSYKYTSFLYKSKDTLKNWSLAKSFNCKLSRCFFLNKDNGWLIGDSIYSTTDGGMSWKASMLELGMNSIKFQNADTGWIVGTKSNIVMGNITESGYMYYTVNGGKNWTKSAVNTNKGLNDLYYNHKTLFMIGNGGYACISAFDGTSLLNLVTLKTSSSLYYINFSNAYVGCIAAAGGEIYRTTDKGTSWFKQTSGTTSNLFHSYFINDSVGWVVGDNSIILKTSKNLQPSILINPVIKLPEQPNAASEINCFPNPFGSSTNVEFNMKESGLVSYKIYNTSGALMKQYEGVFSSGDQKIAVGDDLRPGIYILEFTSSSESHRSLIKLSKQ